MQAAELFPGKIKSLADIFPVVFYPAEEFKSIEVFDRIFTGSKKVCEFFSELFFHDFKENILGRNTEICHIADSCNMSEVFEGSKVPAAI